MADKDEYETIEGAKNFWNPAKEGEELKGKIVGIEDGMYGKRYTIQTVKDGKDEMVQLSSHKVLQNRLSSCALGDEVKIIFNGTLPAKVRGERPTMLYTVMRKKPIIEEKV